MKKKKLFCENYGRSVFCNSYFYKKIYHKLLDFNPNKLLTFEDYFEDLVSLWDEDTEQFKKCNIKNYK